MADSVDPDMGLHCFMQFLSEICVKSLGHLP